MTHEEILDALEADGWQRTAPMCVRSGAVSVRWARGEFVVGVGGTVVSPYHTLSIARGLRSAMALT